MWKFFVVSVLLVPLITAAKIGPGNVIGPIAATDDQGDAPLFGSYFTNKYSKIAREIVHNSNDTMFATIYVQKPLKGYPMIESMQVADSKWNESSTGHVSFYMQKSDPVFANIKKKNQVSALFSNETQQFNNETSQMEKTGYRVLITGFVAQILPNTTFFNDTMDAMLDRHPDAAPVLGRLNTILCKLEIDQVCVLDDTNGPFCLAPDDYYNADVDE